MVDKFFALKKAILEKVQKREEIPEMGFLC